MPPWIKQLCITFGFTQIFLQPCLSWIRPDLHVLRKGRETWQYFHRPDGQTPITHQPFTQAPHHVLGTGTGPRRAGVRVGAGSGKWEGHETRPPRAVYVHMPFCRRRCYYCDFPIKVVGDRASTADAESERYVEVLLRELRATAASVEADSPLHPSNIRAAGGLTSIFFGGGTPSLTPPHLIQKVVRALLDVYGAGPVEELEISMEMDPGTFDAPRLQGFVQGAGVNRVSMGVQSFDASLLKACGRAHSLEDVYRAVLTLQGEGVINYSIDLISSLPNQTMAQWEHSLSEAVRLNPAHVSIYDLQIESGTAFGRWYAPGSSPLPSEDLSASMYATASEFLQANGYEHYEVSNYAKTGYQCRHNRVYWEGAPYLALGMGASSFTRGHRFTRPRSLEEYSTWVGELEARGYAQASGYDGARAMTSTKEWALDRLEDGLMVGLRLREGVDVAALARATVGVEHAAAVEKACRAASDPFVEGGLVAWDDQHNMRLTDPNGLLLSSNIIAELYAEVATLPCFSEDSSV